MAVTLAERLLLEAADVTLHTQLVRHAVEDLEGLTGSERQDIRFNWQPSALALVETARELDDGTRDRIEATVADILGYDIDVSVTLEPALLAGARIILDGRVWDSSLASQLRDAGGAKPVTHIDG
jgi:F0F1-type ATP synthase delta subunit